MYIQPLEEAFIACQTHVSTFQVNTTDPVCRYG